MSFGFGFGFPRRVGAPLLPSLRFDFLTGALDSRITFSRTTNATLFGSNGTLQYAPHNLLTYSEQFDNTAWTRNNSATIAANTVTAPDGTTTADAFTTGAIVSSGVYRFPTTASGALHTASVYVKNDSGATDIRFGSDATPANACVRFNAATRSITSSEANVVSSSVTDVGNGWDRVSVSFVSTSTTVELVIYGMTGTVVTFNVWGAQLNVGALQPYYSTTVKNLLGFTQEFDNAAWTKSNSTVTANVTAAPDGSVTADKLVENTATSNHLTQSTNITVVNGTSYTLSVYAKAVERSQIRIALSAVEFGNGRSALFNLSTGTVTSVEPGANAAVVSVGGGWYRCSVKATASAGGSNPITYQLGNGASSFLPQSYTGDGTSGIYIWGAQLSDSASLDPYVYNPGAAPTATAYYGPRFDYDPVTLAARGLLIEEQRTNQQLYSEDLSQWGAPANATVSTNFAVAPDGFTTADKLVEDTLNASHFLSASSITHSYVSGTLYTRSCFLKASGRFIVSVYLPGATFPASNRQALFNLSAGTVYSVESGVTASIQACGNGWYRCTITATASVTGVGHVGGSALIDNSGNGTYTGDGVSGALIWGAQMEVATFATSYIPTTTIALTRAADVASMTGANFSNWFNPLEGTTVVEASTVSTSTTSVLTHAISDGTFNNSMYTSLNSGTICRGANVLVGGVSQAAAIGSFTGLNTANNTKDAFTYKLDSFAESCNGLTARTDLSGTVPVVDRLYIGSNWNASGNFLNGHIRSFSYYPKRLSASQLQSLTALPPVNVLSHTLLQIGLTAQ